MSFNDIYEMHLKDKEIVFKEYLALIK